MSGAKSKMTTQNIRRFLLPLALLVGASAAQASTITYYVDVFGLATATTTPIATSSATLAGPNTSVGFSIPKLNQLSDPNPGMMYVLTAVQVTLNWQSSGEVDTIDIYPSPIAFTNAITSIPLSLTVDGVTVSPVATAGPVAGIANSFTVTQFPGLTGSGTSGNASADLAAWEGLGNSSITANMASSAMSATGSSSDPHAGGNLFFGGNAQAGGIATFTYTYTEAPEVPEPVTSALTGGALVGLAAFARKLRSRKA